MDFIKTNIILNSNFKNNKELFQFIEQDAIKKGISKNKGSIKNGFIKRENQGTTGFEDGFAIPHARIDDITKPSIYVIRNSYNFHGWDALDGNGVKFAIALLIPKNSNALHMKILSTIATKLMDKNFRNIIKIGSQIEIFNAFNIFLKNISSSQNNVQQQPNLLKKYIVGISACSAGIAHTFMAKQKMEEAAKKSGMGIYWETQGANGQKNKLSKSIINGAEVIIIASDIDLNMDRFWGKKILITSTNDAIRNGSKLIRRAINEGKIFDGNKHHNSKIINYIKQYREAFKSNFSKPWLYLSITASMIAIIALIGFSLYGRDWTTNGFKLNSSLFKIQEISKFALYLSMPLMVAFIAQKLTKKIEAFGIAFIASLLMNMPMMFEQYNSLTGYANTHVHSILFDWNGTFSSFISHGSNIVGSIVVMFFTVLIIKFVDKIKIKISNIKNKKIASILLCGMSPWFSTTLSSIFVLVGITFALGAPLSWLSSQITYGIIDYANNHWWIRLLIGGAFGILISSDLGGTTNKITLISLIGLAQYDLRFTAIISIGIPLISLGYGVVFKIFKKRFKQEDADYAQQSFQKGLNGMTEGPLFATNKYGWRLIMPNVISTFVATGLAYVLGLYIFKGGHIGIWFFGAQGHLAQANDISFLNVLLPINQGIGTFFASIAYGIIGYFVVMLLGICTYIFISFITFSLPGKNKVFKKGVMKWIK